MVGLVAGQGPERAEANGLISDFDTWKGRAKVVETGAFGLTWASFSSGRPPYTRPDTVASWPKRFPNHSAGRPGPRSSR